MFYIAIYLSFTVSCVTCYSADTLVPVVTVPLGEPVTLTCVLPKEWPDITLLQWYKQSAGDTLKMILMRWKNASPTYGPGFSATRLKIKYHKKMSNLTIYGTIQEDEGMYHCAVIDWDKNTCSGTYLSLRGNYVLLTVNCTFLEMFQAHKHLQLHCIYSRY